MTETLTGYRYLRLRPASGLTAEAYADAVPDRDPPTEGELPAVEATPRPKGRTCPSCLRATTRPAGPSCSALGIHRPWQTMARHLAENGGP